MGKCRIGSGRIVFDTDSRLTMGFPKVDESISRGGMSSLRHPLLSESWVSNDFVWNPYDEEHIEKYGYQRDEFVVPIRFSDGKTQDYKFIIVVYHSNPVDYSGISMGMKSKEVKKLQGKPNGKNRYSEKV